jgi:hypothetical protein
VGVVLIVSRLKSLSGIEKDFTQNSWVFEEGTEVDPLIVAGTAVTKLNTFYTAIGKYFGPSVSRVANVHEHQVYDLAAELDTPGSGTGSPITTLNFTVPAIVTAAGLPSEVAMCLSFHAALAGAPVESGATRPRSRRQGRVFLGPLSTAVMNEEAGMGETRPRAVIRQEFADAAAAMTVATGNDWSVWSRADGTVREVVGGWIDNAFDTQRRRGLAPTSRITFT